MVRRRVLVLWVSGATLVAGFGAASCVGDSSGSGGGVSDAAAGDAKTQGGLTQPCYANHTCDSTLSCVSNVCVDLSVDGGSGGGSDGGSSPSDAGGDADGGVDPYSSCKAATISALPANPCDGGPYCDLNHCAATCTSAELTALCSLPSDCKTGGDVCCTKALPVSISPTTCSGAVTPSGQGMFQCQPAATCVGTNSAYRICTGDGDCPGTTCLSVSLPGISSMGLCAP